MATTSAVYLSSPTGGEDTGFYVHYDGDVVGAELRAIIDRDGYAKVFGVFADQPSRFWREITPGIGDDLPEYVSKFPDNLPRCRSVPGYGVLFVGAEELSASTNHLGVDLDRDGERAYRVGATGIVATVR